MSLLNSLGGVGGVGSVSGWVRGWRESNFGRSRVGPVGPETFGAGQKNGRG